LKEYFAEAILVVKNKTDTTYCMARMGARRIYQKRLSMNRIMVSGLPLAEMPQNLFDYFFILDKTDDFHRSPALGA
jgi:hypothetical protein